MFSDTTTTNTYISVTIRNIDFEVEYLEMADADKILHILGTVDDTAQYASKGQTNWSDASAGLTYKFMYSYTQETQQTAHRKMLFRLKLEYPSVVFNRWGI